MHGILGGTLLSPSNFRSGATFPSGACTVGEQETEAAGGREEGRKVTPLACLKDWLVEMQEGRREQHE
jgi:hypothetical protein